MVYPQLLNSNFENSSESSQIFLPDIRVQTIKSQEVSQLFTYFEGNCKKIKKIGKSAPRANR